MTIESSMKRKIEGKFTLILDEAQMIDVESIFHLLSNATKLIVFGDKN